MSNQKKNREKAMDALFGGLTMPSSSNTKKEETPSKEVSDSKKNYSIENERVCTIINSEIMAKVRVIAGKEHLSIRDIFEYGLKYLVHDYESRNGTIHLRDPKTKKGNVSSVFSI